MNFFKRKYLQLSSKYYRITKNEIGFTKAYYQLYNKRPLQFVKPTDFAEKLLWLKFNHYDESYKNYVDKYAVRAYVEEKIGQEYLPPIIGVYDHPDQIDINAMPDKFVLKGTHGSGYNVIVTDKSKLDWSAAKAELNAYLQQNYYYKYFERIYKNVKPRLLAEHYLEQLDQDAIIDYKFFCAHGKAECIWVKTYSNGKYRNCFYTLDWKKIGPDQNDKNYLYKSISKPEHLDKMIELSEKLSEGFIFVRVDLYALGEKIYFGELTFFPWGGFKRLTVKHLNSQLGAKMTLPETSKLVES